MGPEPPEQETQPSPGPGNHLKQNVEVRGIVNSSGENGASCAVFAVSECGSPLCLWMQAASAASGASGVRVTSSPRGVTNIFTVHDHCSRNLKISFVLVSKLKLSY